MVQEYRHGPGILTWFRVTQRAGLCPWSLALSSYSDVISSKSENSVTHFSVTWKHTKHDPKSSASAVLLHL